MDAIMTNKILAAVLVAASATFATSAFAGGYDVAPAAPAAQSNQPLTRAEVRAQLVAIEQAGYNPARGNDTNYPTDAQAAEGRVYAAQAAARTDTSGFGAVKQGTSEAGHRADLTVSP
jgi:FlaG/FlaF family flagellin (archaellin)